MWVSSILTQIAGVLFLRRSHRLTLVRNLHLCRQDARKLVEELREQVKAAESMERDLEVGFCHLSWAEWLLLGILLPGGATDGRVALLMFMSWPTHVTSVGWAEAMGHPIRSLQCNCGVLTFNVQGFLKRESYGILMQLKKLFVSSELQQ